MAQHLQSATLRKHLAQGSQFLTANQPAKAELEFRRAVRLSPTSPEALFGLGAALRKLGKPKEALTHIRRSLQFRPDLIEAKFEEGLALADDGQLDLAASCYAAVIERQPHNLDALFRLGMLFQDLHQLSDAAECYRRVLLIDPGHAHSHANLGMAFLMSGHIQQAENSLRCAVALNPNLLSAHHTLAVIADIHGRSDEVAAHFERALAINPAFAPARFNWSVIRMRHGQLEKGFAGFDARWELPDKLGRARRRPFRQPAWRGEPLESKHLLVWGEQGIGDEVRTAAMVPELLEAGHRLMVECDLRLVSLFQRSFSRAEIIGRMTPPDPAATRPSIAYQIASEDLVRILRPTIESFSRNRPYLLPDTKRVEWVNERLRSLVETSRSTPALRIGISWISRNDEFLDLKASSLDAWEPVLRRKNCSFIDLQYGDTSEERAAVEQKLGVHITHLPDLDLKQDMEGLAALISACDLVITVSNVTAHMAGALGKEAWVILPFGHAQPWYWFTDRSDSPWYPSLRLYRQKKFGDWPNVLRQVADDLKKWKPKAV